MLDLTKIRPHFPAFDEGAEPRFFENAGGSFACRQTIEALTTYYRETKVQPYAAYDVSARAGAAMDRSYSSWAEALGVSADEIVFGPSTSMNTYVLAQALAGVIESGDQVIVTNQDHEANTGATRRMAQAVGAELREWKVDPDSGLLDIADLENLLTERTRLITFPHCSNIVGVENDAQRICALARAAGAISIVDGVSFAPHGFPDVATIDSDVYLFSLYKCYSVHQGLMVLRRPTAERLPNQSHYFNADDLHKKMAPAGPDHAQIAAAARVHEAELAKQVLRWLDERHDVRLLGPVDAPEGMHRCPTVAFVPTTMSSQQLSDRLVDSGIMAGWGGFYANRVLEGMGVDPETGVVRLSWVHYTSPDDIDFLLERLEQGLTVS